MSTNSANKWTFPFWNCKQLRHIWNLWKVLNFTYMLPIVECWLLFCLILTLFSHWAELSLPVMDCHFPVFWGRWAVGASISLSKSLRDTWNAYRNLLGCFPCYLKWAHKHLKLNENSEMTTCNSYCLDTPCPGKVVLMIRTHLLAQFHLMEVSVGASETPLQFKSEQIWKVSDVDVAQIEKKYAENDQEGIFSITKLILY